MTRREVMVLIHSEHAGLSMNGLPVFLEGSAEDGFDVDDGMDEAENEAYFQNLLTKTENEPEVSEILAEGRLITTSRRVELVYEKFLSSEFGPTVTKIGFDREHPEMITLLRSGVVDTAMVFENKLRHICVYNAPAVGFEVCIRTAKVDNRLLTDGVLFLDYYMEIHGVQTERCKLTLSIRDCE